jgi:hypothetical protein
MRKTHILVRALKAVIGFFRYNIHVVALVVGALIAFYYRGEILSVISKIKGLKTYVNNV